MVQTSPAHQLVDFLNASWTPYHAVAEASRRLVAAGYKPLMERDAWDIVPGGKYFFTRNGTTIVAFAVGRLYKPGNGFYMIGAHTDSPCLKLKPVSKATKSDHLMVSCETYGGGLWHTWFDRDLSVAGRVLVRDSQGNLKQRLVQINKPILRIPMLAIHLNRELSSEGFKPNTQNHLVPILATSLKAQVANELGTGAAAAPANNGASAAAADSAAPASAAKGPGKPASVNKPITEAHQPLLLELIAEQLGCAVSNITDLELHVCDTQPSCIGGARDEFVLSGRLDNLAMSFCALEALIRSTTTTTSPSGSPQEGATGAAAAGDDPLAQEACVRAVALFDHEEVGSDSAQGAGGPVMRDTITRVASRLSGGEEGAVERALRQSFLVSADMAHAVHPNYADKHDPNHGPKMHKGVVVKYNGNQRYATNGVSAAVFREVGAKRGIPCQEFSVRNDMPCGSTIGPILATNLGCLTVDVGIPQLAMHSIREVCGTDDVKHALEHFVAFFEDVGKVLGGLDIDALPPPDIQGTLDDPACHHCH